MKAYNLFLLLLLFAYTAFAQSFPVYKSSHFTFESAIPTGRATNTYAIGLGLSLKAELPLAPTLTVTGSVGYTGLLYTNEVKQYLRLLNDNSSASHFVPVKVGLKYYLSPQFYAEGEFGAAIGISKGDATRLAYAPGVGYLIPIEFGHCFDIGVRYEGWVKDQVTLGFIGLHAGFKYALH